jgi:hypothetical protein
MNTALTVALWVSVTVCVIGIGLVSCWLLLDWRREVQQARAAARMARDYPNAATASRLQGVDEFTWPIVAQQPPVFYGKAITIPIPRCVLTESGIPVPRHALEEDDDLWPTIDFDREADLAAWHAASERPTEVFATIPVHGTRSA